MEECTAATLPAAGWGCSLGGLLKLPAAQEFARPAAPRLLHPEWKQAGTMHSRACLAKPTCSRRSGWAACLLHMTSCRMAARAACRRLPGPCSRRTRAARAPVAAAACPRAGWHAAARLRAVAANQAAGRPSGCDAARSATNCWRAGPVLSACAAGSRPANLQSGQTASSHPVCTVRTNRQINFRCVLCNCCASASLPNCRDRWQAWCLMNAAGPSRCCLCTA